MKTDHIISFAQLILSIEQILLVGMIITSVLVVVMYFLAVKEIDTMK